MYSIYINKSILYSSILLNCSNLNRLKYALVKSENKNNKKQRFRQGTNYNPSLPPLCGHLSLVRSRSLLLQSGLCSSYRKIVICRLLISRKKNKKNKIKIEEKSIQRASCFDKFLYTLCITCVIHRAPCTVNCKNTLYFVYNSIAKKFLGHLYFFIRPGVSSISFYIVYYIPMNNVHWTYRSYRPSRLMITRTVNSREFIECIAFILFFCLQKKDASFSSKRMMLNLLRYLRLVLFNSEICSIYGVHMNMYYA